MTGKSQAKSELTLVGTEHQDVDVHSEEGRLGKAKSNEALPTPTLCADVIATRKAVFHDRRQMSEVTMGSRSVEPMVDPKRVAVNGHLGACSADPE